MKHKVSIFSYKVVYSASKTDKKQNDTTIYTTTVKRKRERLFIQQHQ